MTLSVSDIAEACRRSAAAMATAEHELNAADGQLGDGDTGQTMRRLADKIAETAASPASDLGIFLRQLGMAGTTATGSSLGTLICIGLMEMGKFLRGKETASLADLAGALSAAEAAMLARGGAALGDKTALDLLHAVYESLEQPAAGAASSCISAARATLAEFRSRPCKVGRARMFSERSIGIDDPGMLAFVKLVEAIAGPVSPQHSVS